VRERHDAGVRVRRVAFSAPLSAVLCACLGAAIPAQTPRVLPRGGQAYFPLRPGSIWKFRRTAAAGVQSAVELSCRGPVVSGKWQAFELVERSEQDVGFEYWHTDDDGVWKHGEGRPRSAMAGMAPRSPLRFLPAPVGIQTSWDTEAMVPPQGGNGAWPTVVHHGTIDTFADAVTVPAGEFVAVKVTLGFSWPESEDGEQTIIWFVPGIGPVQREVYDVAAGRATLRWRDELVTHTAGPEVVPDPLAVAAAFVAAHGDRWPDGPPALAAVDLPVQDAAVVSRFVVVGTQVPRTLLAVRGETAAVVDLADANTLRELWAAEVVAPAPGPRTFAGGDLRRFATLCLQLRAVSAGGALAPVHIRSSRMSTSGGPDGFVQSGSFDDGAHRVELQVKNGELQGVTVSTK